ncbi:hypothetical protein AAHE18_13G233300 [Arachis hypogaea]
MLDNKTKTLANICYVGSMLCYSQHNVTYMMDKGQARISSATQLDEQSLKILTRSDLPFALVSLQLPDNVLDNFFQCGTPSFLPVPNFWHSVPSTASVFFYFDQCIYGSLVYHFTVLIF